MSLEEWIRHHLATAPALDELDQARFIGVDLHKDAAVLQAPAKDVAA